MFRIRFVTLSSASQKDIEADIPILMIDSASNGSDERVKDVSRT